MFSKFVLLIYGCLRCIGHHIDLDEVKILDREPRWFEWVVREAIYIKVIQSTRNKDGAATNIFRSLFSGQVSRPEIVSLSLMKDKGSSENSEVWKIFCVEGKSFKL